MNFETLLLPDRLRHVMRWNGMPALDRSNVAEHTYRVMFYMRELLDFVDQSKIDPAIVAKAYHYAVIHDLGEVFTGDVSHTIKRKYNLKPALDEIEKNEVSQLVNIGSDIPIESSIIVKLADIIDFSFESWKEINYGNKFPEYPGAIQKGIVIVQGFVDKYAGNPDFNEQVYFMIENTLEFLNKISADI